jgi:hypothetical protein
VLQIGWEGFVLELFAIDGFASSACAQQIDWALRDLEKGRHELTVTSSKITTLYHESVEVC